MALSNSLLSSAVIAVIIVIVSGYVVSYNADMGTVADTVFTGMLDAAHAAHVTLNLTATGNISDGDSGIKLEDATGIATFRSDDGHIYAAVTVFTDDAVQILNITNTANITAVSSIADAGNNNDDLELNGATGITIFESDGNTYAAVTGYTDDGVQILNITNPANVTAVSRITDDGTNTDNLELNGAAGIATFESDGNTYAAVTAYNDNGVQILDITNPANVTAAGNFNDVSGNSILLDGSYGITIFESDGDTYAAVAVRYEGGVQILNITNPASITAAGNIENSPGLWEITTFESGSNTYAAATVYSSDQVKILNITNPDTITIVDSIRDDSSTELNGPRGITTFYAGGHPYIAVAAGDSTSDGVQIIDVSDPSEVTAVVNIAYDEDSNELNGARGITKFKSDDGYTYLAVTALVDDAVQIIRVDGTRSTTDNMAPRITLNGLATVQITINGAYIEENAVCRDNVDADKLADVDSSAVNTGVVGTYTVYYNCADVAGNSAPQVTRTVTVQADSNTPPQVDAGPDLPAAIRGQEIPLSGANATDTETPAGLTYAWTVEPLDAVTFDDAALLNPTITVADDAPAGLVTLRLTVNDGTVSAYDSRSFTVTVPVDPLNTPPQVNAGPDLTITKDNLPVTLTGATATDAKDAIGELEILWTQDPSNTVTIGSETTLEPTITVLSSVTERTCHTHTDCN